MSEGAWQQPSSCAFGDVIQSATVKKVPRRTIGAVIFMCAGAQRTRDALAAKKAQGVKLGGLNAKGNREEALERAEQLRLVFAELAGMSHRKMAAELNARKIPTPAGGQWHAVTVKRVLSRLGRSRWALAELIEFRSTVRDQSREAIANEVAPCSRRSTFCFWKHSGGACPTGARATPTEARES